MIRIIDETKLGRNANFESFRFESRGANNKWMRVEYCLLRIFSLIFFLWLNCLEEVEEESDEELHQEHIAVFSVSLALQIRYFIIENVKNKQVLCVKWILNDNLGDEMCGVVSQSLGRTRWTNGILIDLSNILWRIYANDIDDDDVYEWARNLLHVRRQGAQRGNRMRKVFEIVLSCCWIDD